VASQAPKRFDGALARRLFADAATLLHRHIDALNAINVFPVPDGDTGTNMHLTLRAGLDELAKTSGNDLSAAISALAHGALMGARGNSGVILSQVLHGFADAITGHGDAGGPELVEALQAAKRSAYAALSEPVEGTILTVIREAAEAVGRAPTASVSEVLSTAVDAAKTAVERTPELLPALKEAGVVDAGGLGLAIILEGLLRSLRSEPLDVDLAPANAVQIVRRSEAVSLHRSEHGESGYCTEFMVSGRGIDPNAARAHLSALGSSLLVVGGADLLRVHIHTTQPDDALAYGRSLGELTQVKVDNLEAQIESWLAREPEAPPPVASGLGIVAVAAGEGIEQAFRSVGATHFVKGGQTMNPSAGEILEAIESCPEANVIVLPNNKNIIASAQQAAEQSTKRVAVIFSRSIPQGVAALLALSPDLSFDETASAMERALSSVRSAEVTRAVRATTIDGQQIAIGQAIGIVDGKLRVVAEDIPSAVVACVNEMRSEQSSLLTLYAGRDVRDEDASTLARELGARYADLTIELVPGGQPHYQYLLSLE
jgi:hypothetical protein